MIVATEALSALGEVAEHASMADSGNTVTREFCPRCGSQLFARSDAQPQFRVVRVGNLDDPSSVRPAVNIWVGSAPAWAGLDPELGRVPGQPPPPAASATPGAK